MIIAEDGTHLYFERLGGGPRTILMPNGLYLLPDFRHLAEEATLIAYDVRNRGRSDTVRDPTKLARGIEQDADDLDAVRRMFGTERIDLIGHSYIGLMVALYAMRYAAHVRRIVLIGPVQPDAAKQYPPQLTGADAVFSQVMAEMARMSSNPPPGEPEEVCRKFWSVLSALCVVDPADAERLNWVRCDLPNERNFGNYWAKYLSPSIERLKLTDEDFSHASMPALVVHGVRDRNAPYGGARDWAALMPNARLVTVPNAAHAPWIEAPDLVFSSIRTFLGGEWPDASEKL